MPRGRTIGGVVIAALVWMASSDRAEAAEAASCGEDDAKLKRVLAENKFSGRIESQLERRLGRPVDQELAALGQLLWFDVDGGLRNDNTCGGCHSPSAGFADTQSIAIGVQNNGIVGPGRTGPRNQRRTPSVINSAFYPALMWNGRFFANSGDPFDNSQGFTFPAPEGTTRFPAHDPAIKTLLAAQGHIPPTELVEVAGFTGTKGTIGPRFDQFDDGQGGTVPAPDESGFRNEPIRQEVLKRLNGNATYRAEFARHFPEVKAGGPIDFSMFGRALAEFEFVLTFADAPVDRYARGDRDALTAAQKRGALTFFGKGRCSVCHSVSGRSNEMFSDFENHNVGVPQIAPFFGAGLGNMIFDGPAEDEDFGLEQVTGRKEDRYKFRTSPLRNVKLQPAFFHNGAFTRLEDAIRHHLDIKKSLSDYDPARAGVAKDLRFRMSPPDLVLATVDPVLKHPVHLSQRDFKDLVDFVANGLLDRRAEPKKLCKLIPASVPSGRPVPRFEGCPKR